MADLTGFRVIRDVYTAEKYKKGLSFEYRVCIPEDCPKDAALCVSHDFGWENEFAATLQLAKEGRGPYTVCVGIGAGVLAMPDGTVRNMRMNSYDLFDREYGDFVVYEFLPYITEKYGLSLSQNPEKHLITGGSSGGISAFCIAWYHPDAFRKVFMSSPSFLAMGRGNEIPYLVRKCEPKPLRIYQERSENEPNEYFGASFPIDLEAEIGLSFAGYDFKSVYFPGEGHCSRSNDYEQALIRLAWLWDSRPIATKNNSRVLAVIPEGSVWEKYDGAFPENRNACAVSEAYDLGATSADKNMVYAAEADGTTVYSLVPGTDCQFVHAYLHTVPDVRPKIYGMDVDECDRTYVLTGLGIQCIRSYGLVDVILNLPDSGTPEKIAFDGDWLCVKTGTGTYHRKMLYRGAGEKKTERKFSSYYD